MDRVMHRLLSTVGVALILFLVVGTHLAFAGFGVTPPFVRNTSLTRNSTYEQQILLVRGNPTTDLKATVQVDAPDIQNWITITNGTQFLLPKGAQKVPMTVQIKVPPNAPFKDYTGSILIKTGPANDKVGQGAVNISLGAQVDIDLTVINKKIRDFRIRKISIGDLNAGHKVAWLYFPGKINMNMLLENTGNVKIAPSQVTMNIYDPSGTKLLESTKNIGAMKQVAPYDTQSVIAALPTHLPPGPYLARYKIYNGSDVKLEGEATLNILKYGTLQAAGFGFVGLSIAHKLSILLPIFALIITILLLVYARRERTKRNRA